MVICQTSFLAFGAGITDFGRINNLKKSVEIVGKTMMNSAKTLQKEFKEFCGK